MSDNTRDLSCFGFRELKLAAELLSAFKTDKDKTKFLSNGVSVEFNPNSANVFLVDEDCNVAMMNGENLEDWFVCPQCGHEGLLEDIAHKGGKECKSWVKEIKGAF
jgi:hypothetical protein